MTDPAIRNAKMVSGIPCGPTGEDGFHAAVGQHFPQAHADAAHWSNTPIGKLVGVTW